MGIGGYLRIRRQDGVRAGFRWAFLEGIAVVPGRCAPHVSKALRVRLCDASIRTRRVESACPGAQRLRLCEA
jgi:hypothetical protein